MRELRQSMTVGRRGQQRREPRARTWLHRGDGGDVAGVIALAGRPAVVLGRAGAVTAASAGFAQKYVTRTLFKAIEKSYPMVQTPNQFFYTQGGT